MAALVHVAVGFACKPLVPRIPVGVSILFAVLLDLLAIVFTVVGIETTSIQWTHGLMMSIVWSLGLGLVFSLTSRDWRIGAAIAALVGSHWIVDFITHPMGAVIRGHPTEADMPLLLQGSPNVGLGLYNNSIVLAYLVEFGALLIGIAIYVVHTIRNRRR